MAEAREPGRGRAARLVPRLGGGLGALLLGAGLLLLAARPALAQPVGGATPYDSQLFALTNQDRTSNGEAALAQNSILDGIAEDRPYYGCSPSPIYGRAADMLTRDYFSHQIPGCSADAGYVWPIMSADGVPWESAGENVGWLSGYSDPAAEINQMFMDSAPHRANILGDYDELGVGSWYYAGPWNYPGSGGGPYSDVYMFAEEFVEVAGAAPPPSSNGSAPPPPRSSATPAPTPTPTPTPKPKPKPPARGVGSREPRLQRGLLSGTIDQVISSYLDE